MRPLAALLLLALALAGCSDDAPDDDANGGPAQDGPGGPSSTSGTGSMGAQPAPDDERVPVTHESVMRSNRFEPADIAVRVGDTVHWTTEDPQAHNVVSDSEAAAFRSPDISTVPLPTYEQEFSYTFEVAGTVPYVCEYHPGMEGTITVSA